MTDPLIGKNCTISDTVKIYPNVEIEVHDAEGDDNKMGQMIDDGFTICMWPKSIVEKDINDMILSGLSSNVLLQMIDKNKVSGLEARMALSDWSKVSGS